MIKESCQLLPISQMITAGKYLQGAREHCPPNEKCSMVLPPQRNQKPGDSYRKIRPLPLQSECTNRFVPPGHYLQLLAGLLTAAAKSWEGITATFHHSVSPW